jgi:hypothetical protein
VDNKSFDEVNKKLPTKPAWRSSALDGTNSQYYHLRSTIPFIPFKHGDKFVDKFADVCRAASISMFTNGSKLYATSFFSETPQEEKWIATPDKVIKGSLEVRNLGIDSVATEWNFSVNTWDGQKTLSMGTITDTGELEQGWQATDDKFFHADLIYRGYIENDIPGFGARASGDDAKKFRIDGMYSIKVITDLPAQICKLVSLRMDEAGADALFIFNTPPSGALQISSLLRDKLEITPLAQQSRWREAVSGNLAIDYEYASYFWKISQAAFEKAKQKAKLDERYSKHQVAAFGGDEFWPQRLLKIAEHNSFAKTIISFKVPINHLPKGSLSSLLLKRITLAFGRFREDNALNGWIVGYSFAPAENSVRIEFLNSEPVKDILWLDETKLPYQKIVDEREHVKESYSEA